MIRMRVSDDPQINFAAQTLDGLTDKGLLICPATIYYDQFAVTALDGLEHGLLSGMVIAVLGNAPGDRSSAG